MAATLVVDANELFSFFREGSARKFLIEKSLEQSGYRLIAPSYMLDELLKDKDEIMKLSGIGKEEFALLFSIITIHVSPVPEEEYAEFLPKAGQLAPHPKDAPYFAVALAKNCAIWSDEKAFKRQRKVKVITTAELFEELNDF